MEAVYFERERDMSDFEVVSNGRGQDASSTADARHMDQPDATFACDRGLLNPTPTLPMRPERRSGPAYGGRERRSAAVRAATSITTQRCIFDGH